MTRNQWPSGFRRWAIATALLFPLASVGWVRLAKAQGSQPRLLLSAPVRLMSGYQARMACLNGSDRPIDMRFHLVNATTAMPVANSSRQNVAPRTSGFFDVFPGADLYYMAVEMPGTANTASVACAFQILDASATTVTVLEDFVNSEH